MKAMRLVQRELDQLARRRKHNAVRINKTAPNVGTVLGRQCQLLAAAPNALDDNMPAISLFHDDRAAATNVNANVVMPVPVTIAVAVTTNADIHATPSAFTHTHAFALAIAYADAAATPLATSFTTAFATLRASALSTWGLRGSGGGAALGLRFSVL
jgi:hypothetical protein